MSRKKYMDFPESAPISKPCARGASGSTRLYVEITCPHCMSKFTDLPVERVLVAKAGKCKEHLLTCTAAKEAGVVVEAPAKPPPSTLVNVASNGAGVAEDVPSHIQKQLDTLHERADKAETKMARYDAIITEVLPSYTPPLNDNTGCLQLTEAIKIDLLPTLMPPVPEPSVWPPEALTMAKELASLKHERAEEVRINRDRDAQLREMHRTMRWLEKRLREDSESSGYALQLQNLLANRCVESGPKRVRFA